MRNKKIMLLLLLIILLGIALRFSALDREAYWLDEGFAMITGEQESLSAVTDSVLFYETAPPLYFYILKIWIDLFGNSEFSTRFLSALFSLLSIVFIFLASRRISDDKTALFTSLLFTISMISIWLAQEVRPYSQLIFLTVLSTYFLIQIFQKEKKTTWYLLYFFSLTALVYTSYFSVFVIFFQFMAPLFAKRYKIFKWTLSIQLISSLLLFPWLFKAFSGYNLRQGIVYELLLYHANLPESIAKFGQFALISPIVILSLLVAIFYLLSLKYKFKKTEKLNLLITIFILLFLLLYLTLSINLNLPNVRKFFTWIRYFIVVLPAIHFIIAKTVLELDKKLRTCLVALIIIISSLAIFSYYTSPIKEEWVPAMSFIEQTKSSSDGIILVDEGGANMYLLNYYYNGEMEAIQLAWKDEMLSIDEIKQHTRDKEFAWLILSRNWKRGDYYKIILDENFNFIESRKFHGIELYLYQTNSLS